MALNIISNVQLDMKAPNTVIVYANQYDSAGSVKAQLLNSGESWSVPAGAKAVVMFKKSDNIGGFYDVTEFGVAAVEIDSDRSIIYINYDPQVLTTAGRVAVQINFYQNDQRLSSFAFYTDVQASAVTSGEIASSWLFNILSQEIAQTLTVATTPQAMTDWLEANITQETGYVIDNTLTVAGAASDAQATGKMVTVSNLNPNIVANKVWVKKTPAEIQIPTCEEVDELSRQISDITIQHIPTNHAIINNETLLKKDASLSITYNNSAVDFVFPYEAGNPTVTYKISDLIIGNRYNFSCYLSSGKISQIRIDTININGGYAISNLAIATSSDNIYSASFTVPSMPSENGVGITIYFMRSLSLTASLSDFVCIEEGDVETTSINNDAIVDLGEENFNDDTNNKLEKIESIESYISDTPVLQLTEGYLTENGKISSPTVQQEKTTQRFLCSAFKAISVEYSFEESKLMWLAHIIWYNDGSIVRIIDENKSGNQFNSTIEIPKNAQEIAFSYRSFGEEPLTLTLIGINPSVISDKLQKDTASPYSIVNPFANCNVYDHLFIDIPNSTIPAESLTHINISKRLGFNMIEANTAITSDGKYIVLHGDTVNGTLCFGNAVKHIDGITDVSNIPINSKSLSWIKENLRYKSALSKYQETIPTIEEFCYTCKANNMMPVVQVPDSGIVSVVDSILGKNWIAYNASRAQTDGIILHWAGENTKTEIIQHCVDIQPPFIYCMSTPSRFNDEDLIDIVNNIHNLGCYIATAYVSEVEWQRDISLGFDAVSARWQIPAFDYGDIANISSDNNFSDLTTTGSIDANNNLVLAEGDTVGYTNTNTYFLYKMQLMVTFDGEINISMGRINEAFTSNSERAMIFTAYGFNNTPSFNITSIGDTTVKMINFKCAKV